MRWRVIEQVEELWRRLYTVGRLEKAGRMGRQKHPEVARRTLKLLQLVQTSQSMDFDEIQFVATLSELVDLVLSGRSRNNIFPAGFGCYAP
jgi:hypothetical protein